MSDDGYDSMDAEYEREIRSGQAHTYNGIWAEYDRRAREEAEWDGRRAEESMPVIDAGPWKGWREAGYTTDEPGLQDRINRALDRAMLTHPPVGPTFPGWAVKSSGDKESWETGAVRDSQDGKLRYDLIDPGMLARVAEVMRKGAEHYGEFNWTKGIPSQRYMASLLRHVFSYYIGDDSEDHLAAAVFNIMGLMRNEGTDLDDLFDW